MISFLPIVEITRPPAEDISVQSDHECSEAGFLRTVEHGDGNFFVLILWPVELEPPDTITIGFGGFFDVRACGCAHHIGDIVLSACASNGEFSFGVEDACSLLAIHPVKIIHRDNCHEESNSRSTPTGPAAIGN